MIAIKINSPAAKDADRRAAGLRPPVTSTLDASPTSPIKNDGDKGNKLEAAGSNVEAAAASNDHSALLAPQTNWEGIENASVVVVTNGGKTKMSDEGDVDSGQFAAVISSSGKLEDHLRERSPVELRPLKHVTVASPDDRDEVGCS